MLGTSARDVLRLIFIVVRLQSWGVVSAGLIGLLREDEFAVGLRDRDCSLLFQLQRDDASGIFDLTCDGNPVSVLDIVAAFHNDDLFRLSPLCIQLDLDPCPEFWQPDGVTVDQDCGALQFNLNVFVVFLFFVLRLFGSGERLMATGIRLH